MTKLLLDYATKNNIILKINEKDHHDNYPLLKCISNNDLEMTNLLIEYANQTNMVLE